jgi:cytoskeletal protein CcmA (bactofilin family)
MKQIKTIILAQLALLGILLYLSAPAWANLAANTQIINQATLSYNDGAGARTATASVTVTISLVPAALTIVPGANQSTSYTTGATLTDSFTVTSGANGPDTYSISTTVTGSTNTTGSTAIPTAATVILGASVTTTGSTTTVIVVPADGNLAGEVPGVNGIAVGDTIVITGEARTVTAIVDNATGTSTITLASALSISPNAGVLVAERQVIQATITPGTITTPGTDVTVSVTATVTSTTDVSKTATSTPAILNTFTSGVANLSKYVRNVTKPGSGTGVAYVYNSINYYPAGVTAEPGNTLEYILVASNTSTSGGVSASVITDALPTSYVTFKSATYTGGKDVTYVSETNAVSYLTAAGGDDAATYSAPTLTVYIGTGATSSTGGTIPAVSRVIVLYQVTVNP